MDFFLSPKLIKDWGLRLRGIGLHLAELLFVGFLGSVKLLHSVRSAAGSDIIPIRPDEEVYSPTSTSITPPTSHTRPQQQHPEEQDKRPQRAYDVILDAHEGG